jgi:hypothetical protein
MLPPGDRNWQLIYHNLNFVCKQDFFKTSFQAIEMIIEKKFECVQKKRLFLPLKQKEQCIQAASMAVLNVVTWHY